MKLLFQPFFFLLIISFLAIGCDEHLDEKIFKSRDITVKWYRNSAITSVHDFIDIERSGWTQTIMKANTDGIYDILIEGDTITIQTIPDLIVYDLASKALNTYIRVDSTIEICQYMKKQVPENAKYHCDVTFSDTSRKAK